MTNQTAALTGRGTSSEVSKKGTGPKPIENEATKAKIEIALIIWWWPLRPMAKNILVVAMPTIDARMRTLRPRHYLTLSR